MGKSDIHISYIVAVKKTHFPFLCITMNNNNNNNNNKEMVSP